MAVQTIVDDIGFTAFEPLDRDGPLVHVVVIGADGIPLFIPVEFASLFGPVGFGVLDGALVIGLILFQAFEIGAFLE